MINVVVDTNVLLSGLLTKKSKPSRIMDLLFVGLEIRAVHSTALFLEYHEVLNRKKFAKIISLKNIEKYLETFLRCTQFISITSSITDCKDPKDNMLLELAVDGKADCIITGDKLVLELHPFRGIPILNPSDFLDWMGR